MSYFFRLALGQNTAPFNEQGLIVRSNHGIYWMIMEKRLLSEDLWGAVNYKFSYIPWGGLPPASELIFRQSNLNSFKESFGGCITKNTTSEILPPKSRNAMLRTIEALSGALINGLTDQHHTNAEACISVLESKGIVPPVKKEALAKYLGDAKNLQEK